MSRFALTAALAIFLGEPALAQNAPFEMPRADDPPPDGARPFGLPDSDPGPLDGFFNDLITRAQPHLEGLARDMGGLMQEYGPAFEELSRLIDDIANYEMPPERLPNGDIILRRKADAPPPPPLEDLPGFLPRARPAPEMPPSTPPDSLPVPGQNETTL